MDTGTIVALVLGVLGLLGGAAGWVIRFGRVEAASETAKQALAKAESAEAALAAFKVEAAQNFATAAMVAAVEGRVVAAIDRLGDRLDRFLEARPPSPAPRSRATKQ